jgi:YD repeat-containing protein
VEQISLAPLPPAPLPPYSLLPTPQTSTTTQTTVINYAYDPLYRLTNADYNTHSAGSGQAGESFAYTYDAASNRQTYSLNGTQVATYTYDIANCLTEVRDQLSVTSYQYDDNGNLINDGLFSYTYDSANRLTQISDGTFTTEYVYNGDGVRVAQITNDLNLAR